MRCSLYLPLAVLLGFKYVSSEAENGSAFRCGFGNGENPYCNLSPGISIIAFVGSVVRHNCGLVYIVYLILLYLVISILHCDILIIVNIKKYL